MAIVLLIEPDNVLAKSYKAALTQSGHKVLIASNAQDGIDAADKQRPEVVILELQLVGHSGIEFLYEFRSYLEWQAIPVILQSVVPAQEFEDNLTLLRHELGVAEYLYKPTTSLDKLISTVGELTSKNQ